MGLEPREPESPRHTAVEVETALGNDGMAPSVEASGDSDPQAAQSLQRVGPDALKKSNSDRRRRRSIARTISFLGQSPKGNNQMNVSIMVPVERTSSRECRSPGDKAGTSSACCGLSIGSRQRAKVRGCRRFPYALLPPPPFVHWVGTFSNTTPFAA